MRVAFMASATSIPDFYRASADEVFSWHGGNTGNVAFVNAINSHLKCTVTRVDWSATPDQLKQAGDVVVIACANQLGLHTDLARTAGNLDKAGLPIVAVGLGAQADSQSRDIELKEGTRRWVEVIKAHRPSIQPNIGVRGEYTLEQLHKLGLSESATVTGCPSNLTNLSFDYVPSIVKRSAQPISYLAVALGHPFTPSLMNIDRQLMGLVDETNGTCVVQHGLSMIKLAMQEYDGIDQPMLEQTRKYFKPNLSTDEFKEWCRRRLLTFADAQNWMAWLRRHDFVVGPRFHGVMLAIQAGVPAGCIAHDSRTLELCETMAIPVRMYNSIEEPLTLTNLPQVFPFDPVKYRTVRAVLAKQYASILMGAGVPFDNRIMDIANSGNGNAAEAA